MAHFRPPYQTYVPFGSRANSRCLPNYDHSAGIACCDTCDVINYGQTQTGFGSQQMTLPYVAPYPHQTQYDSGPSLLSGQLNYTGYLSGPSNFAAQAPQPPPQPPPQLASQHYDYCDGPASDFVFKDRPRPDHIPRQHGCRGAERGWSLVEDNFIIATKEHYGLDRGAKDLVKCTEQLDSYVRESFPNVAKKRSYKTLSTFRDHWKHTRNGTTPSTCLVNTYQNSEIYNNDNWRRERQWIRDHHLPPQNQDKEEEEEDDEDQ
ncbi:hypothetical protein Dda_6748 [Drechslerella dactyloides]|uniref:Uncharacterized protein n=1 Tax=Drechslerella dactyloides TaxID=74499 RepID=A0AAD6NHP4_DREDA|nr:hypothetical protein Dda_6748 [Drechslerella dactyloides]